MPQPFHVVIIGAGSTGAATAHDLALRGFRVTVVERGEIASGTTGRNHCLLHSGARYAVNDPISARECIEENFILRRIMPDSMELNDGYMVAVDDADYAFKETFLEACEEIGIPTREVPLAEALAHEPNLSPNIKAVVQVPDGVFEPFRFCLSFLATAQANGAVIKTHHEVIGFVQHGGAITGVQVRSRRDGRVSVIGADMVINAAGPWCGKVAHMAGCDVPVVPTAGVMVSVPARLNRKVIHRLHLPGDGDILVPQRMTSLLGTSSWRVEDPDAINIPREHVQRMYELTAQMIPVVKRYAPRGVWAAARPLIGSAKLADGRALSRTFESFDHAKDGVEGFVTITGGKTATARAMAEKVSDLVCRKLGVDAECRTREVVLLSHRAYRYTA
ncbi:MAG: FAD-dependent oxidoreductase [Anaerolineae bacterium]|nr:FAD-dependent oxidoreductase [Thermoflexales bacterium]MDW8053047.1 FAD-dependent oxidoreductase [Anaerolineae bacterium]MDW8291700.1 FAD-dependent oxidoreductase [Anaerolineae bacterium]